MRIGHGFDAHPLVSGRPCILGGVTVEPDFGPGGHSDGDVVLHALADALLGASAAGDLGSVFGTNRPELKNARGATLVSAVRDLTEHPRILNVDVTVLGDRPRIAPFRDAIRESIASLVDLKADRVSVKASSGNGLTEFGRGEGLAATVVVLVDVAEEE
jgi:2-C-methyl-D-erythritol 2,4-cyclodiphosphate synthase